ncbi:unnamed protein product [Cyprideis torosa]|uniref:Uncharacterized protein n=1 Tax=Cyprideis torosa TaxID=163714 RepID=A0A7R8W6Q1_9CRUS|nr:unnamed protein product [Cyprideis torosa]CAG0884303.1 unnamed protein product [Cyprideis torosa]
MFGIGRDPDLPQVTLWRDFEEPVQLPTVQAGDLHYVLGNSVFHDLPFSYINVSEEMTLHPGELSFVVSNPPQPFPATCSQRNLEDHKNGTSEEEHSFEVVHVNGIPERVYLKFRVSYPEEYSFEVLHLNGIPERVYLKFRVPYPGEHSVEVVRGAGIPERVHLGTWLHVFSFVPGFHPVVKILLAHGADPNSVAANRKLTPLHIAATSETARLLLEYKAEVNVKDSYGCTPLFQAAVNDRHPVVEILLAHGADPNIVIEDKRSPLHHARSAPTAELLIVKDAKVNAKNKDGETPLFFATKLDRHSVVKILLTHGADPNITNEKKTSPLHEARSAATAELLIVKDAKVNAKNKDGETPLFFATKWDRHSVVEVLLTHGADPNITNENKTSPLHEARSAATAKRLIEGKANMNAKNETTIFNGNTPLFIASEENRHSVVEVLLGHGADPNITNEGGISPLHVARSAETVERLIEGKANVNAKTECGETPLLFASRCSSNHSVCEALLAHGADPNITDNEKTSPLHETMLAETATLLIQKKANVNAKTRSGETPLFTATERDCRPVIKVLLAHRADPNIAGKHKKIPLHVARSAETAELLIQRKANVNATDKNGKTPLFAATENDCHPVVEVLLAHGADPNIASKHKEIPLHVARSAETAELLIEKTVDVNARDKNGETPLFGAILNLSSLRESVVYTESVTAEETLPSVLSAYIARNGNLNEQNKEGNTLLHLCCQWGNEGAVKCILNEGAKDDIRNMEGQTAFEIAISKGYLHIASNFPHYFPSVLKSTQEFEILSQIGEGGYGKVYKVKKLANGEEYALKSVTLSGDPEKMKMSLREVRAAMRLGGSCIVKCYDAWIEEGQDDENVSHHHHGSKTHNYH